MHISFLCFQTLELIVVLTRYNSCMIVCALNLGVEFSMCFFPLKFGGGRTHLFQPGTVKSSMILTAVILVQSVPVALIRKRFVRSQHPESD